MADRFVLRLSLFYGAFFVYAGLSMPFMPAWLAAMAISPVLPLGDAYALRGLQGGAHRYGSVRLWGSVTFIIANLAGGLLLARLGAQDVIWAVVAALGLTAAAAFGLARLAPEAPEPGGMRPAGASLW